MLKVREVILKLLHSSHQHMNADEIYLFVKQQVPTAALGTVYRNLNQLADSGQIRRVKRIAGADSYEGNVLPHDHLVCVRCGKMSDLVVPGLKDFLSSTIKRPIVSFDLVVDYVCPECLAKEAQEEHNHKQSGDQE